MTTPTAIADELISAAQGGDGDAMWEIVSAFEPFFVGIVRQAAPKASVDQMDDLLQDARAVLVEKLRDYDSSTSSAALQTYVYRSVRRCVAESWTRMTCGLSVEPATILRVRRALWSADGNRDEAADEMYARHGMERSTFLAAVETMTTVESLDTPRDGDDGEGLTLADVIADPEADVTDSVERRELAHWLLSQVDSRQSYALRSYFGIQMDKAPDDEVAAHLRVSTSLVRKIRSRGVANAATVAACHGLAA